MVKQAKNESFRQYILRSSLKTAWYARLMAKGIDLTIGMALSFFLFPLGPFCAIAYFAVADYLQEGQSIGKRMMGLKVVSLKDSTPCSLKQSCIRNLPFALPLINTLVPFLGFLMAFILLGLLVGMELYFLLKLGSGHRLGDIMADTTVIANDPFSEKTKLAKLSPTT